MTDPDTRFESLINRLRARNYRLTPQRHALLQLIAASDGHPNVAQLYERVKLQFPTMSQATVYKTLDLLKELGEVLEIDLRGDSHYDGNKPFPHPHLICLDCHMIQDGELDAPLDSLVNDIEHVLGFKVVRHQLNFYGLCTDCQMDRKPEGV